MTNGMKSSDTDLTPENDPRSPEDRVLSMANAMEESFKGLSMDFSKVLQVVYGQVVHSEEEAWLQFIRDLRDSVLDH